MKAIRYVIGMDGGGTKTAAIIAALDGTIVAEHVAGPSNFQMIGVDAAAQTIFSLINECCRSARCLPSHIRVVTLGLTGAGRPADQKRMADGLKRHALAQGVKLAKLIVESDARIALEGAFKGAPGIILIAGTGSIAFGKDANGVVHRVGGWGRILGDEGSGFFIGRSGLTAVTRSIDGRGERTLLSSLLTDRFHLTSQSEIIAAVYKNGFDVASVAPLVLDAASKKDRVCMLIVEQAAAELTHHIRALTHVLLPSSRKKVKAKIPVSFIGGLIANDTLLRRLLIEQVTGALPLVHIAEPLSPPAFGAVVLSLTALQKN